MIFVLHFIWIRKHTLYRDKMQNAKIYVLWSKNSHTDITETSIESQQQMIQQKPKLLELFL